MPFLRLSLSHWLCRFLLLLLETLPLLVAAQAPRQQWDRTLGGHGDDELRAVLATADGGYLVGGGSHAAGVLNEDKTERSQGEDDFWLRQVDAQGRKQWDKTLGSTGHDWLSVLQVLLGGEILIGGTSNGGISGEKSENPREPGIVSGPRIFYNQDYWVVKFGSSLVTAPQHTAESAPLPI